MKIAAFINAEDDASQLLHWGYWFALAKRADLLLLHASKHADESRITNIDLDPNKNRQPDIVELQTLIHKKYAQPKHSTAHRPNIELKAIYGRPLAQILQLITDEAIALLVIPRYVPLSQPAGHTALEHLLFQRARCETVVLRPGQHSGEHCQTILAPCARGPHCHTALQLAQGLANASQCTITALYVEPSVGADAESIGLKILNRILNSALGSETETIQRKIVVSDHTNTGVASACEEMAYDLVLVGESKHGFIRRMLFSSVPETLMNSDQSPAIAVVRAAIPMTNRLGQALERFLQSHVPQLERDSRVSLVERVQSNSQWNFDFIALLALSTVIATFGLIQNSTAVVIGAMLVAPLMTPLLGIGLALVQGNLALLRSALQSVILGFILAFVISWLIGLLTPVFTQLTAEMLTRTVPGLIDLIVAFVSGLAAAYATSRPNLSAALPGVAIAAALVPPLATAGLALALASYQAMNSALLLFLTNIMAIVFATSISLWAVGLRGSHIHSDFRNWSMIGVITIFIAMLVLVLGYSLNIFTR